MKKKDVTFGLLVLLVVIMVSGIQALPVPDAGSSAAMDETAWKFRSDIHNSGVYNDGGIRPAASLLWNCTTGGGIYSSPAVVNGVVYAGSDDHHVYAVDAATGAVLWKFLTGDRVVSSPAVTNGTVYIGSNDGNLYALDAASGALLWNYTTGSMVYTSPAVANGTVYAGSDDHNVYALDAETGASRWNYMTGARVYSSPAVANGVVFVGSHDRNVYALDAATGTLKWSYFIPEEGNVYSSPAVKNGVVYVGNWDGYLLALEEGTGALRWSYRTGHRVQSSPAVANGIVYVGSVDQKVYAFDAANGTHLWNFTTGNLVYSSPAVANGVVYIGSEDRTLYALDAATGSLIWNYTTGGGVYSSPAVSDGVVYFGSEDGNLYALGNNTVHPPVADFTSNRTTGDAPLDVHFRDTSTGTVTTRFWQFGDGTSAWENGTPSIAHTYQFPGIYTVSLTAGNSAGQDTATKTGFIQVDPSGTPPGARFTAMPALGTAPVTVRFTDRSSGSPVGWQWDFGDGNSSSEQNPTHTYTDTGRFRVTLTASNSGGSDSFSSYVWVRTVRAVTPLPTITPGPTIPPVRERSPVAFFTMNSSFGSAPMSVQFTDISFHNPTSWQWQFGDGQNSTEQNPVHTFTEPGRYAVRLTVQNTLGESSASRRIYVR